MKKIILVVGIIALLSACSVEKKMAASGGSKADGIVRMSYEYGGFEIPTVDKEAGLKTAIKRCNAWGYKTAEPFDASTKRCTQYSLGSCDRMMVTTEYQCLN